jgi:predicted TIM-barrel fold metal-dependent hydrolase
MQNDLGIIDCDIHHNVPSIEAIFPYLPRHYRDQIKLWGMQLPSFPFMNGGIYGRRVDSFPSDGTPPGSNLEMMSSQYLTPYHVRYGILTGEFSNITTTPDVHYAAALCSAYNDWTLEHMVAKDDRLRASLQIPMQDPQLAVKEIKRLENHPRVVQTYVNAGSRMPYGQRYYHPIYEACVEHHLPFAIHVGNEGVGINNSATGVGYPSYYVEYRALRAQVLMAHMASYIFEGVFELFPQLKIVFLEAGVFWVAPYLWRLDMDWKGLRYQTPWVKKLPSEYFQEHMYVGTQPIEPTPDNPTFEMMMKSVYADKTLLFSSDYPHWDFDDPKLAFPKMNDSLRDRIFHHNAAKLYGLERRESVEKVNV